MHVAETYKFWEEEPHVRLETCRGVRVRTVVRHHHSVEPTVKLTDSESRSMPMIESLWISIYPVVTPDELPHLPKCPSGYPEWGPVAMF